MTLARGAALGQGIYYAASGLWPLVSMPSFLAVTGPKTDLWLVKTTGLLIAVIGASLIASASAPNPASAVLAVGAAAALAGVDVVFVAARAIAPIYLADAALEAALLCLWGLALAR